MKELEENGIGRPSTYASILATIQNREYVEKDKGQASSPPSWGCSSPTCWWSHFRDIVDVEYTAQMEEELDEIEEGRLDWVTALKEFHKKFSKDLKVAAKDMRNVKTEEIPTERVCNKCGKPMVIKWGRYGEFLACTGYPECKNTAGADGRRRRRRRGTPGAAAAGGRPGTEDTCEKCGKAMVLRRGRFGQFLACTAYPACKNTKKITSTTKGRSPHKADQILDENCPKCGKQLAVKDGRFGEFTACSDYPECRYIKLKEVGVDCPEGCGGAHRRAPLPARQDLLRLRPTIPSATS